MPLAKRVSVEDLKLDLRNFRTTPQRSESKAIHAMIAVNPDWFWALMESLLDDGYHITENILVLQTDGAPRELTVKEGNRRIGALKLILGIVRLTHIDVPEHIAERVKALPARWKSENSDVPCAIYTSSERDAVDRIVALTHGKGQKAGRDSWQAVARARHNREMEGGSEPALDLLERYLRHGTNLTEAQKERWAGAYPLTVLEEALKRLAPRLKASSARELADQYPKTIPRKKAIELILCDIGLEKLGFQGLRNSAEDMLSDKYGIPAVALGSTTGGTASNASKPTGTTATSSSASSGGSTKKTSGKTKAVTIDDPKSVARQLRKFAPKGNDRDKLATLLKELKTLKVDKYPHAFCFLLRSMFEISAKAYCKDHANSGGPKTANAKGEDRKLVDVLGDVAKHLTASDPTLKKTLHGAMAELARPTGFLSVTSMNQLVHNPKFSTSAKDICILFTNVFPLLEQMNS